MDTKLNTLKRAFYTGNYAKALSIAAKFGQLGKERNDIKRGHEAIIYPAFYEQLGYDPNNLIAEGIKALRTKYKL